MSSNKSSTTLQSWRERPPSSYSLKVNNFPVLVNSTLNSDGRYQSQRFSSFDFEWRLIIYPKGNEHDNGNEFISMYVEIDSKSLNVTTPAEVYADLRFFVFNKKENKYFIIQDVESKPFNTVRMMWGLSQVLPLETFNNHINGYLLDGDQCEFGVDIFVSPPPTKLEIVSFNVKLHFPKFSWSVKNFSEIKENFLRSKKIYMGGKLEKTKQYTILACVKAKLEKTSNTMMSSNKSSRILQSWRERPPSSYSLKVKNFPVLVNSTLSSRRFSSSGYKWRLIIYSKGNEKDNGSGFISMYVEIDSKSLKNVTTPAEVYADLRFFVFNKKENKYLIIQDVESKPFNTLRMMCGLSQVLPLETFNNHINGYLFDEDHCEFGVEIFVSPPPTKLEIVSFNVKPFPEFSWSVKNFSEITENFFSSTIFSVGGKNWFLQLFPKGRYSSPDSKWLSIFLNLAHSETLKEDEKIYVQANLKVEDPYGCSHKTHQLSDWFAIPGSGYGWDHFLSIADLRKSYLDKEDTLKVEIEFKVISATALT